MGKKGFTLVELVMVIVVVIILSAVAMTRWNYDPVRLSNAARKVAADIRYAQKLAITTQARSGITFSANGFTVFRDVVAPTIARSPGDPCSTDAAGNFVVDFTAARCDSFNGVVITDINGPIPPPVTIAFNSMGSPVNVAGNALVTQIITLSLNGVRTITIQADTGRVNY
jgi:prepilin-type N-terminal cleavage/methylation domain-containing protein